MSRASGKGNIFETDVDRQDFATHGYRLSSPCEGSDRRKGHPEALLAEFSTV